MIAAAVRHCVSIRDNVGKAVEADAEETEGRVEYLYP